MSLVEEIINSIQISFVPRFSNGYTVGDRQNVLGDNVTIEAHKKQLYTIILHQLLHTNYKHTM